MWTFNRYWGVVKKSRGRNVHCVNDNRQLCNILGDKGNERILNIKEDFCYLVAGTVQFWLHEKNPVKEFIYRGDTLFESHIQNNLELIFTIVLGDGVQVELTLIHGNNMNCFNSNCWAKMPFHIPICNRSGLPLNLN